MGNETEARPAFRAAWRDTLASLGTERAQEVLVAGRNVHALAEELPSPTSDEARGLAVLGPASFPVPPDATPMATGLPDASMDVVVMLSAWSGLVEVGHVVREAGRVVRPGGTVWLGEPDLDVLTRSMPATYRAGLLYQAHPGVGAAVRAGVVTSGDLGVGLVRAGLRDVTVLHRDIPLASFATSADAVEAVRAGIWPGIGLLSPQELDDLLDSVRVSLRPPVRFPVVDFEPWTLVRGRRAV